MTRWTREAEVLLVSVLVVRRRSSLHRFEQWRWVLLQEQRLWTIDSQKRLVVALT